MADDGKRRYSFKRGLDTKRPAIGVHGRETLTKRGRPHQLSISSEDEEAQLDDSDLDRKYLLTSNRFDSWLLLLFLIGFSLLAALIHYNNVYVPVKTDEIPGDPWPLFTNRTPFVANVSNASTDQIQPPIVDKPPRSSVRNDTTKKPKDPELRNGESRNGSSGENPRPEEGDSGDVPAPSTSGTKPSSGQVQIHVNLRPIKPIEVGPPTPVPTSSPVYLTLFPTEVPTSLPTSCPTNSRECEWDVIFLRQLDSGRWAVTIVDIKLVGDKSYKWRQAGLEVCPLSVMHEIGVGHYAPYINHDDLMKIAPPFGYNIYKLHPEARSRYVFDYDPGGKFFEEDGSVKAHVAVRIMNECREAHKKVMRIGDGIQYHRSRLFAVTSYTLGGNLETTFWMPLQILSRAPWEAIPQRTPILEKCAFDEAIRQTGNARSLLPPFQATLPVIAIESKSSQCRDEPLVTWPDGTMNEGPNLRFWKWDRADCLTKGFRFDVGYARRAKFVGVQFFRQKFTGPSGGLIGVFNSEVILKMMDEEDGSYYNNGMPVLSCTEVREYESDWIARKNSVGKV